MKIFLDDVRDPKDCLSYMYQRIGELNPIYDKDWTIVRKYHEFVEAIDKNIGDITHVSFDHDLSDIHIRKSTYKEKTGFDCAKYLKQVYEDNKLDLPVMFVHSMNPIGTTNIINLFK